MRSALIGALFGPLAGCWGLPDNPALLPPRDSSPSSTSGRTLVARIVHVSDAHVVDTESPARFAGAYAVVSFAWRPWEAYSTQLLDGIVRTTNRIHASGSPIDFVIHTGDECDNAQANELEWFLDVMDGRQVTPLSGPDDRVAGSRPIADLDPYATFQPQGLYRTGVHGPLPSIPWYSLIGNHETYALGTFPIVTGPDGGRTAPLPLTPRPGVWLPAVLDPTGYWAHGSVTPANPGPPELLGLLSFVEPEPRRAYFDKREFVRAMFATATGPPGHGFEDSDNAPSWYSVSPVAGLRLIGLDTSDTPWPVAGLPYDQGCISAAQRGFLSRELDAAQERGELVIVASHHSSQWLQMLYGSAFGPDDLRAMLNEYPNVVLHLIGHDHWNRVADRGGYVEMETCSTLDLPQEGRVIEIWRDEADGSVLIGYHMFSHVDDTLPPLGEDPLRAMREQARAIAERKDASGERQKRPTEEADAGPRGAPSDRDGVIRLNSRPRTTRRPEP